MIILVVAALGIAGTAAFMVKRYLDGQAAQTVQPAEPSLATEQVLVVSRDIGAGAVLIEDDLRYEEWPKAVVDRRFVVRPGVGEDPKRQFVGATARRALAAGEPITGNAVFRQDEAGFMSGMLSPGMRAVSIALTPTNSVAGFIGPGDRVDVVLGLEMRGSHNEKLHTAEVLFSNVRVLAIDTRLKAEGPAPGKTATIEVTPEQAESIITAGAMGSLYLVLRSLSQEPAEAEDKNGFSSSLTVSRAVRAITGGGAHPREEPSVSVTVEVSPRRPVRLNRAGQVSIQSFSQ
ncbi:MAG: Flp pilus assembly protein CpaB [Rhodospirillales bacterium]|nr:Flp pilus assembly protein CpaB [Rhodospirillales bacterium]